MKKNPGFYATLFREVFALSAFTVGGGFVIVPLMKGKFVDKLHWLEEEEMLDITAIAQSAPGAIAVNAAILVGYRLAGFFGALTAIGGTILPPMLLLTAISAFYDAFRENALFIGLLTGMRAGVAAVIADVVMKMALGVVRGRDPAAIGVMAGAFAAVCFFKVNVILVILVSGLLGFVNYLFRRRREKGKR